MCARPPDHDHPDHIRPALWPWLTALLIWSATLLILSLLPVASVSSAFDISDKLLHFLAYAVLTVLLAGVLSACPGGHRSPWLVATVGAFGYGLLIEALQAWMQLGRSAEWGDQLANTLGILCSCVVFRRSVRRYFMAGSDR